MENDEPVSPEPEVRRTRSGRTVRSPAQAQPKQTPKRKKKMVLVEVEVSDEEEEHNDIKQKKAEVKDDVGTAVEEKEVEEKQVDAEEENQKEVVEAPVQDGEPELDAEMVPQNGDSAVVNEVHEIEIKVNEVEEIVVPLDNGQREEEQVEKMDEDVTINEKEVEEKMVVEEEEEELVAERKDEEDVVEKTKEEVVDKEKKVEETAEKPEVVGNTVEVERKINVDPDAENISEDELPGVQVAKVPETEEVSDEELPGPKRAELPADTEIVSEDELPTVKKESGKRKHEEGDYDPNSPTSEEGLAKKLALDTDGEKEKEEKVVKPKKLPELDKYWKPVNDDPTDFTGWTYLLQYVDQENDMEAAREAYDAFLSHYPYCYGYWRKYADYEKRKGNKKKCEEVFERGLKAIPLSVDLWIHYLTYVKTTRADDEEFIRSQFERALTACGLEFRSDRLWDGYIKWETEAKRLQNVTSIYDRLLATPTQGYTTHFDNFQEHVASNPANKVLEVDEFLALRKEVRHMLKHDVTSEPSTDNLDVPPGDDDSQISSDEETKAIRERIVSIRRKIHKNTVNAVTARWNYEEGIKRPYFHVKPLERCQLKNWQEYLDYEMEQGDQTRTTVLFERCLIACALYEEFWLRYVHYLEGLKDPELQQKIKDVYERACTIHHLKKPNLHLQWAMFEESIQNFNRAAEILVNLEKSVPNVLQIAYRRINLERRRGENEKCALLYEHYINNSKNKLISSNMAIKYARFCFKILKNLNKALEVLTAAITKDPLNPRLHLQLIDLTLQKDGVSESEVLQIIDSFLEKESADVDQKVLFAQRKLEFLEDFGTDIQCVQKAYDDYQKYIKQSKETGKKKDSAKSDGVSSSKKDKNPPLPSSQSNSYGSYGSYGATSNASYQYSGSQQGQYGYSQYGQGDQYQYQNWQYPQSGYGSYNQWGGYGGGYSY